MSEIIRREDIVVSLETVLRETKRITDHGMVTDQYYEPVVRIQNNSKAKIAGRIEYETYVPGSTERSWDENTDVFTQYRYFEGRWSKSSVGFPKIDPGECVDVRFDVHSFQPPGGIRFYTAVDGTADGIPFRFSGEILKEMPHGPDGARPPLMSPEAAMLLVASIPAALMAGGIALYTMTHGGCFVTTAAFGDAQHPMVREFRHLRDKILANYRLGRRFINWYNRRGPQLASLIEGRGAGRAMGRFVVRSALRPVALAIRSGRQFNNAARFFKAGLM